MGYHIDNEGRFQSDEYPDLGPDKIVVSFKHPEAWPVLRMLALVYEQRDPELSEDILERVKAVEIESTASNVTSETQHARTGSRMIDKMTIAITLECDSEQCENVTKSLFNETSWGTVIQIALVEDSK